MLPNNGLTAFYLMVCGGLFLTDKFPLCSQLFIFICCAFYEHFTFILHWSISKAWKHSPFSVWDTEGEWETWSRLAASFNSISLVCLSLLYELPSIQQIWAKGAWTNLDHLFIREGSCQGIPVSPAKST